MYLNSCPIQFNYMSNPVLQQLAFLLPFVYIVIPAPSPTTMYIPTSIDIFIPNSIYSTIPTSSTLTLFIPISIVLKGWFTNSEKKIEGGPLVLVFVFPRCLESVGIGFKLTYVFERALSYYCFEL